MKLNHITTANPSGLKIELYRVTTMVRLANADMTGDEIAKKRKFYFTFADISGYDLDVILEAIWEGPLFFPISIPYNGTTINTTVYAGSIPMELHRAGKTSNWVWKNVTFDLIER